MVDCEKHRKLNERAAKKSAVLLKNENAALPLDKSAVQTIGVIGPNANNRKALVGNYEGTAAEYITILEGIQAYVGDEVRVLYSEGCHLCKDRIQGLSKGNDRMSEVRAVADASDVIIACMGLDASFLHTNSAVHGDMGIVNEFASGDKPGLNLPGLQEEVLKELVKSGKPVVLVLLSGSALAVPFADEHIPAILQGWYPGARGGKAIADILFGEASPEGKLPVTFYRTTEELPDFRDYSMKNRTYRYMKQEALYPFGYGLSYTDFDMTGTELSSETIGKGGQITVSASVKNTGKMEGAETVQVYIHACMEDAPNYQLKALKKITLKPGEEQTVSLTLTDKDFGLYNEDGEKVLNACDYEVYVGTSQPDPRSAELLGRKPVKHMVRYEGEPAVLPE